MDKIEKIKKFVNEEADRWQDSYCDSMRDNLLSFLDTLESDEPEGLEEAMDIIPRKLLNENKESYTFDSTGMRFPKDCVKAGAKWMANKGVTFEDSIYPTTDNEGNITGYCIDGDDEFDAVERGVKLGLFEIGDKVLVQIRKIKENGK